MFALSGSGGNMISDMHL